MAVATMDISITTKILRDLSLVCYVSFELGLNLVISTTVKLDLEGQITN